MSGIGRYEVKTKGDEKSKDDDEKRSYGTHTLPQKFWTIKPGTNLLNDDGYKKRKREKKLRYEGNKAARAEENRERSHRR